MTFSEAADQFEAVDPGERVELLVDFGRYLPPLPEAQAALRDAGLYMVRECQSPVYFHPEAADGVLHLWVDAPREAPVARGFVGLLYHCLNGQPIATLETLPPDALAYLGLKGLLGMQRTRGLSGIYARLLQVGR